MAKGDYYFPLYYKRLLTSTIGWKDDEFGAYVRLLIHQFDKGTLPSDINELSLLCTSIKKNKNRVLKKFKDLGDGHLINEVMEEIYQDVQKKKDKNIENGRKGGRPKNNPNESPGLANGFKNETQTKAIPITNNQQPRENTDPPVLFSIEHCITVAMNDERWVRVNKATVIDLKAFNAMLERRGIYEKNPADYKEHYYNWKAGGKKEETGPINSGTIYNKLL